MTIRSIVSAASFAVSFGLALWPGSASAQYIQPGMRTMIQQGGTEPGPVLGYILPGPAEAERIFREDERWVQESRTGYRAEHPAWYDGGARPRRAVRVRHARRHADRPIYLAR